MKKYYNENKTKLLDKAKNYSKNNYGNRIIYELNNNLKGYSTLKEATIKKWAIKYDEKNKIYYIFIKHK